VAQAGLTLAGVGDKLDVIVRNDVHFAPSSPGTPIQVGVQSDRVVIVVATPPEVPTWLAVNRLLGCLLDSLASPEAQPPRAAPLYRLTAGVSVAGGPHTM
jgi:hypothetical protein